jgi:arylsulfatase A-like enzyme
VAQVDLLPSVLDCCGIPLPGADWTGVKTSFERGSVTPLRLYPGESWLPLVHGRGGKTRSEVVIENDDPTTGCQVRCLVTDRHRLTVYPGTPDGELFDLAEDPDELSNLWYRPDRREPKAQLIARLLDSYARHTPSYPVPPWNS